MLRLLFLCSFLFASVFLLGVSQGQTVNYFPCNSTGSERNAKSTVHSVSVTPCTAAPAGPCEIATANANATITVDFTPKVKIGRRARQGIYWAKAVDVQLRGLPKNACGNVNCTLGANVRRTYEVVIPMKSSFPKSTYNVKSKVYEGSKTIFCVIVQVKLV